MFHFGRRIAAATGVLAVAALAVGCAAGDDPGDGGGEASGGSLTFAIDTPLNTLDPNLAGAAQEGRVLRSVVDSLVSIDDSGQIQPWLATEWEVSEDNLTYTFTLQDGVQFTDGTPLDAEAVCANFDRIADPASGSLTAVSLLGPYQSCEAPDEHTVIVTMTEPFVPFLNYAASTFLGIVSPTALAEQGPAAFAQAPVGSGPFLVESYTPNDRVVMKRNEDYAWGPSTAENQGPAHLDELVFQIIPDATVRIGSLRSGEVDMIGVVPETEFSAVQGDSTLELVTQPQPGTTAQLFLNQSVPGLEDIKVREAIRSAIDFDTIVDTLYFGAYDRAWGLLTPVTPGYSDSAEDTFSFDPDHAKKLLDEAGWTPGSDGIREKDGNRLSLRFIESDPSVQKKQDYAEFIKQYLAEVGIEVELAFQANAPLQADRQSGNYALATLSYGNLDPNVLANTLLSANIPTESQATFNLSHIQDPELDELVVAARSVADLAERERLYQEIQDRVVENVYTIGMYVPVYTVASSANASGLAFSPEGYPAFYDAKVGSGQ